MNSQHEIVVRGARGALELRRRHGLANEEPICVYRLAELCGVGVRFFGGNSFGGMYDKRSQTIVVPTLRPPGRQTFTCGHELGHWYYGHGSRLDEWQEEGVSRDDSPEERLVDAFAAHLLMPSRAVKRAFDRRGWKFARCTPFQVHLVACQLGVGYTTLVYHLCWALKRLSAPQMKELLKTTPKQLRDELLGTGGSASHLVLVDEAWTHVPVNLRVGDMAILPAGITLEGTSARIVGHNVMGELVEAVRPGITQAERTSDSWACFVRVSRRDYVGRSINRFLEETDDE